MAAFCATLNAVERGIAAIAIASAWITILTLIGVQTYDIVARQFIPTNSAVARVFELRSFMFLILLGLGYAYLKGAHVRVDVLRNRFGPRIQAWIEVFGGVTVLLPLAALVIGYSRPFVWDSYVAGHRSLVFFGLPLRWVVKGMLPFGFFLLALSGLIVIARNALYLAGRTERPPLDQA
jgi:TRAP-type mannitol/chloroaromatic compound transport system permease small subunit